MAGREGWMMARMLGQLPLPLLPAGAAEIAPGVGLVTGAGGGGLVSVHGLATFAWDAGDEAGRRAAPGQLGPRARARPAAGRGLVSVHGLPTFAWDAGDEAGRRLAAVQLVRLRAVSQARAAAAFGVDPVTVWRWDQALAAGGVAGLVPARRGPEGGPQPAPQLGGRVP